MLTSNLELAILFCFRPLLASLAVVNEQGLSRSGLAVIPRAKASHQTIADWSTKHTYVLISKVRLPERLADFISLALCLVQPRATSKLSGLYIR